MAARKAVTTNKVSITKLMKYKQASPNTFRFPISLSDRLKRIAGERNLPKNQIAKKAIELYLDQLESEKPSKAA